MSDQNEPRHPIAVVARRSGLSQQILRAWERRYNLVTPQRTPTGRRLYTDRDLEMLGLLKSLIDSGYRVGSLKERTLSELRDMATTELDASVSAPQAGPDGDTKALLDEALDATAALDPERLEAVLQRASVALSRPALRSLFLQPLLTAIGMRWQSGELRIAHEHMASSLIHTFLASLNNRRRSPIGAPRLVAATLPGQQHELGLLLATSHVLDLGWDVIYLGADLPIEEIASTALKHDVVAVLTSLVYPLADPRTSRDLEQLGSLLPRDCMLVAGGQAAPSYAEALIQAGAGVVDSLDSLESILQRISS